MEEIIANSLIYLAGLLWGIDLVPQVVKTVKTKNVEGISLAFYILCLSAYLIYAVGNVMLENWNIVIAHVPSFGCLLAMIILIIKYRRKKNG